MQADSLGKQPRVFRSMDKCKWSVRSLEQDTGNVLPFQPIPFLSSPVQARTGYPFIDAIMTQLRQEGWIHHLARHAVACFLTRGDLWVSWEEGQKVNC